ncbi:MAG: FAD-binding oxidoreductase [Actinobacteria bacterium]|nr:FAD-binding oxidoreductase [Actinomycetota bacterium]
MKKTSNLFRTRTTVDTPGLDVAAFDGVLSVDAEKQTADVLGMTTYEHLVDATLPHGLMPLVVPQLKTITLGGAVTGLGIESSSFREGLPHESVLEMDVLTGSGEIVTVTSAPDDPNRDLYLAFPNSYGSLGYALRLRIALMPIKKFVHLRHLRYPSAGEMALAIEKITADREFDGGPVDFLDGTVFSPDEQYLTLGTWSDELPIAYTKPSDYTRMGIFYRSIQERAVDVLTARDYIWRWDTDWFWCSRAFGAQIPAVRALWPKRKLRSDVYWKIIALARRFDISGKQSRLLNRPLREDVIQDVEVPVDRLAEFLDFFHREVGISPIWVCPLRSRDGQTRWPLYDMNPDLTYVNVGFWSTAPLPDGVRPEEGTINRRIEEEVARLDGHKSLYSSAFYPEAEFDQIYGGAEYRRIKKEYDPEDRLTTLFAKVVQRR